MLNDRWRRRAKCLNGDREIFYPDKGGSTRDAKRLCQACPVVRPCLRFAFDSDERFGVWGDSSERERRKMRKVLLRRDVDPADLSDDELVGLLHEVRGAGDVRRAG